MIDLSINTDELKREALSITRSWALVLGDLRDMFGGYDVKLSKQIEKTFKKEGPGWASLAPSTRMARRRGWGYYKTGGRKAGDAHPIGVWTGKAKRRAMSNGKALRKGYTRTFGKDDAIRKRVGYLHKGGPYRAPRPIYRKRAVERLLKSHATWWLDTIASKLNRAMKSDELRRIAGRIAG